MSQKEKPIRLLTLIMVRICREATSLSILEKYFGLLGRVAIVTGGGQGIGRSLALALAEAGADVAVLARSQDRVRSVAQEIEALGRGSLAVSCDVTDPDATQAAIEHVAGHFGRLDILINAAGTISRAPALEMTLDDWQKVIDTNLSGAFWMSQAAARKMIPQGWGRIINIASATSRVGLARRISYSASKGGIVQLTRALSSEWAAQGICVNAIAPGWFRTEINATLFDNDEWRENLVSRIPAGRPGQVEDLQAAAIFLAGEGAGYVSGHTLYVDGGFTTGDTL